ncbi:MAG: LysM peptidoglycan-binding domain-containing protein, partial [Betaproteobacteria bacterium]
MKKASMVSARLFRQLAVLCAVATLVACAARRPAPVSDARPPVDAKAAVPVDVRPVAATPVVAKAGEPDKVHVIQKGETLISIALQNGLDYRELAAWNNIENPNVIKLGETLRLTAPGAPVIVAGSAAQQPKPGEPVAMPLIITPMPVPASTAANTDKFKTEPKATKLPYSDAAYAKLSADAAAGVPIGLTPGVPVLTTPPVVPATASPATGAVAAPASDDVDWAWPIQPAPKGKVIGIFTDA